jgi:hypothetical protein
MLTNRQVYKILENYPTALWTRKDKVLYFQELSESLQFLKSDDSKEFKILFYNERFTLPFQMIFGFEDQEYYRDEHGFFRIKGFNHVYRL